MIFNTSANNHVVFDISNKFFGRITVKRINFILLPCFFAQFMDLFLKLEKQIWSFQMCSESDLDSSLQHLSMLIFKFWYVKFMFSGSYNLPAHFLAPVLFLFPSLSTCPHLPFLSASMCFSRGRSSDPLY